MVSARYPPVSTSPVLGLQVCATNTAFHVSAGDLNSGRASSIHDKHASIFLPQLMEQLGVPTITSHALCGHPISV